MRNSQIEFQFNKLHNASLHAEWGLLVFGILLCVISVLGNGYVSYRLMRILRISKTIQTPIYLSLTIIGLCTGVFCMPYMLYSHYTRRIVAIPAAYEARRLPQDPFSTSTPITTTFFTSTTYTPGYNYTTDLYCPDEAKNMTFFDRIFCNVSGTVFNITCRLLVWTMLLLSIDRYIFICHPYRIHLVKKKHYAGWIGVTCAIMAGISLAPYIFYYPEVIQARRAGCPAKLYQPYKFDYKYKYQCDYPIHVLLNTINVHAISAFYFITNVVLSLVPITLNVTLSVKVLYEVSKMRKMSYNTTPTKSVRLNSVKGEENTSSRTGSPFVNYKARRSTLLNNLVDDVSSRLRTLSIRLATRRQSAVLENKASFTMLILSLFYIVSYSVWVVVWCFSIPQCFNSFGSKDKKWMYLWLYNSKDGLAYYITNHYPIATFANAAFVPCLLAYSLKRGK